ncbi:hypothetical protein ACFYUV_38435 [Nonomuraea sp. NPDC003560]|uniref:hypothetical protein n=1 Tax=Nonomuraea sp. NPDC003560 TaxID=3364341 RepID=UPI0036B6BA50
MNSEFDDVRDEDAPIPRAVYRQLDDHLGEHEEPYDVQAGLGRLMQWMQEESEQESVVDLSKETVTTTDDRGAAAVEAAKDASAAQIQAERIEADARLRAARIERDALLRAERIERDTQVESHRLNFLSRQIKSRTTGRLIVALTLMISALGFVLGLVWYQDVLTMNVMIAAVAINAMMTLGIVHVSRSADRAATAEFGLAISKNDKEGLRQPAGPPRIAKRVGVISETGSFRWALRLPAPAVALAFVAFGAVAIINQAYVPGLIIWGLLLTGAGMVLVPAVWSSDSSRRQSALDVLQVLLGRVVITSETTSPELESKQGPTATRVDRPWG